MGSPISKHAVYTLAQTPERQAGARLDPHRREGSYRRGRPVPMKAINTGKLRPGAPSKRSKDPRDLRRRRSGRHAFWSSQIAETDDALQHSSSKPRDTADEIRKALRAAPSR